MNKELIEKVAERLYLDSETKVGEVNIWEKANEAFKLYFRRLAKQIIPVIKKAVAEEIKEELEKEFVETFESGEGIVLSTGKLNWQDFWGNR